MSLTQQIVITSVGWFVAVLALVYAFVVSAVNSQVQDTNESLREAQPADVTDLERRLRQAQSQIEDYRLELDSTKEQLEISETKVRELNADRARLLAFRRVIERETQRSKGGDLLPAPTVASGELIDVNVTCG